MIDHILVPLDGSPESEAAVPEAKAFAGETGQIHLIHVLPNLRLPMGVPPKIVFVAAEEASDYLEGVLTRYEIPKGRFVVETGDPADRILRVSLELNIDLIVMATHARSVVPRILFGAVAGRIVRESWLPVLLIRTGIQRPKRKIDRILVPLDGSEKSRQVLDIVAPLANRTRAEVILLQVREPIHDPMGYMAPVNPHMITHDPLHQLQEIADQLEKEGLVAWPRVVEGDPVNAILGQAKSLDVDLIAMATHGFTGLDRVLMGSVAEGVLHHADRPVLMKREVPSRHPMKAD